MVGFYIKDWIFHTYFSLRKSQEGNRVFAAAIASFSNRLIIDYQTGFKEVE